MHIWYVQKKFADEKFTFFALLIRITLSYFLVHASVFKLLLQGFPKRRSGNSDAEEKRKAKGTFHLGELCRACGTSGWLGSAGRCSCAPSRLARHWAAPPAAPACSEEKQT